MVEGIVVAAFAFHSVGILFHRLYFKLLPKLISSKTVIGFYADN